MPYLEVILNVYSVNSGETYSLQIDERPWVVKRCQEMREFDSFVNTAILSQADLMSEGATTNILSFKK